MTSTTTRRPIASAHSEVMIRSSTSWSMKIPGAARARTTSGISCRPSPADPSRTDPTFTELLESLREYDQTEPGLITRDGVLVNGNTRRAALLKMGGPQQPIRVAVLPESCDWEDIRDVELSLQLRKEHRRDYSYINRLLAIDELVNQGLPIGKIAAIFRAPCRPASRTSGSSPASSR